MINRFRMFLNKMDDLGAAKIAALYMFVGGAWILFSDRLVALIVPHGEIYVLVNIYKGWGFILVTGIMLYLLVRSDNRSLQAANKNYLLLAENISDVIWILDLNTSRFTYISPSIQQLRGLTVKEAMLETMQDAVSPASWEYLANIVPLRIEEFNQGRVRESYTDLIEQRHKDGSTVWVEVTSRFAINPDNGHWEVYGTSRDVTERKRVEKDLRESEETYRYLFGNHPHPMWIYDLQSLAFLEVNEAAMAKYGYSRAEFQQMTLKDIRPTEDLPRLMENLAQPRQSMEYSEGWRHRLKGGSLIDVSITSHSLQFNGRAAALVIAQDITDRKQAEEALRESERQMRALVTSLDDIVFELDEQGKYLHIWTASDNLLIQPKAQLLGKQIMEVLGEEIGRQFTEAVKRVVAGGPPESFEYPLDVIGGKRWFVARISPIIAQGESRTVSMLVRDITGRKLAENALKESEERFNTSFHSSPIPISITDIFTEKWVEVNEAFLKMTGHTREEIIGHTFREINLWKYPEDSKKIKKLLRGHGRVNNLEVDINKKNGDSGTMLLSVEKVELDGKPFLLNMSNDITERKLAEKQVQLQLQRMSALAEIDRSITSSLDMRLSLDVLLNEVITQLGVNSASVLLLNSFNQKLEYVAGKGYRTTGIRQSQMLLGKGLAGRVAVERKILHIPRLTEMKEQFTRAELLKAEGFVEYFGVPLIVKSQLKGVLEIFNRTTLNPNLDWMNYLETLGGQAAIAIDNAQLFEGMQRSNLELITAYDATIAGWSRAMDLRDRETEGHTQRVTDLTLKLAERMGINPQEQIHIRRGALLHDIGKLGVPDQILHKPGPLTEDEWNIMRQHPTYAFNMLMPINYLRLALDIPYCHHEKWDGTGYPHRLKAEQIPMSARIFAVVDVWDALCSDRPYRKAWTNEKTREYLREQSGKHFDPRVVETFLSMLDEMPNHQ